jgi:hypothetical protein
MEMSERLEPSSSPSISSAEGSPVRISRRPENEPALKALAAAFGLSSPVSLGSFDPATFLLKTSQASLFQQQCPEWSENWPDSGMWDAGGVYELQTSEPVTSENESSLWPGTRATSGGGNKSAYEGAPYRPALAQTAQKWPTARQEDGESCGNHPGSTDSLTGATKLWRTPDTPGAGGPRNRQDSIDQGHQVTIAEQAEHWQTPHGMGNRDRSGKLGGCGGGEFGKQANQWNSSGSGSAQPVENSGTPQKTSGESLPLFPAPDAEPRTNPEADCSPTNWQTPAASWHQRGELTPEQWEARQANREHPLSTWGTPTTRDWKDGACQDADVPTNGLLGREVVRWPTLTESTATIEDMEQATYAHNDPNRPKYSECGSPPVPQTPDGPQFSESAPTLPRRLNPRFVEWLMGFPIGWSKP